MTKRACTMWDMSESECAMSQACLFVFYLGCTVGAPYDSFQIKKPVFHLSTKPPTSLMPERSCSGS